jgi:multidrug efflux pump subunit AcrA (membrane-fusion protein)
MKYRFLSLIFLSVMVAASCTSGRKKAKKEIKPVVKIQTARVSTADMMDTIQIYGEVKLRQVVNIASQFDGRLSSFSLLPGDRVKKGEALGMIIPPMREALLQSMGNLTDAQKQLVAEEVKEIPLFSPINGVVLEVMQHTGDVLQKGEAIVRIADLKHLDVYGDLPVKYLPLVKSSDKLAVHFINLPHKAIILPVSAFSGKVDTKKQTLGIRLAINNHSDDFRPGMQVVLRFPGVFHQNATVIPRSALLEEEGVYSVFVVHDQKAEKRTIQIGIRNKNLVEVLSGLNPGETVATEKAYSLTDGMEVIKQ